MILYFAGNVVGQDQVLYDAGVRNKLLTFAEIDDWGKESFEFWVYNAPSDVNIFMDCGAYSAMTRGVAIDIYRYIEFCQKWGSRINTVVQLDKVGDPVATARNLEIMEREGVHPIPVYTAAAPIKEFERLCERYKHIALGGVNKPGDGTNGTIQWRREVFNKIFKAVEKHWPIKMHAFGVTAQWVLERYPLYSADSSSAIVGAGMGRVMCFDNGVITSEAWADYARRTYNAAVVDGIGEMRETTTSAHIGRRRHNIRTFVAFERYLNTLWERKGITWEDTK